jgi:hypothetical protein
MIAMVSNMSVLQIPIPQARPVTAKCNRYAVFGRAVLGGGVGLLLTILPMPAAAQSSSTGQTLQSPPPDEHRVADTVKFLAGAALGLGLHEGGHLVLDTVFDASPRIEGVHFGPFPFFAITHRSDVSPRREFAISSAGFWMQDLSSEWLLTKHASVREARAPVAKGVLAFNVLNSVGYACVAFARAGPFERDTRGMGSRSASTSAPSVRWCWRRRCSTRSAISNRRRAGRNGRRERPRQDRCCWWSNDVERRARQTRKAKAGWFLCGLCVQTSSCGGPSAKVIVPSITG